MKIWAIYTNCIDNSAKLQNKILTNRRRYALQTKVNINFKFQYFIIVHNEFDERITFEIFNLVLKYVNKEIITLKLNSLI